MRARILVTGRVQRVGYRNFVRVMANRNRVNGIVRNLNNGMVEIFADGPKENVDQFIRSIQPKNPTITTAIVEGIEINTEGSPGFSSPWKEYGDRFIIDRSRSVLNV